MRKGSMQKNSLAHSGVEKIADNIFLLELVEKKSLSDLRGYLLRKELTQKGCGIAFLRAVELNKIAVARCILETGNVKKEDVFIEALRYTDDAVINKVASLFREGFF